MSVIIDTSVWSLVLRRKNKVASEVAVEFQRLVKQGDVIVLGPIRQELLCGIKQQDSYDLLCSKLRAFPDFMLLTDDYETAAAFYNKCRSNGIQGSNTDFLICAVASRCGFTVLTSDKDFNFYSSLLPVDVKLVAS